MLWISNVWPLRSQANLVRTLWAPKLGIFYALRGKSFFDLWISYEGTKLCFAAAEGLKGLRNILLFEKVP